MRKKATVYVPLCARHWAERKRDVLITVISLLLAPVLIIVAIVMEQGVVAVIGAVALLFGMFYGLGKATCVSAARITEDEVRLRGARKPFLNTVAQLEK